MINTCYANEPEMEMDIKDPLVEIKGELVSLNAYMVGDYCEHKLYPLPAETIINYTHEPDYDHHLFCDDWMIHHQK